MVLGRVTERAAVDHLLTGANEHRSGSLVLTGDPGIGKSTLLAYGAERARELGMTALSARGYESESEIPFAGLADLLRPVLHLLPVLPAPQARALESALSLGPPVEGDRFSVCTATIGMLAAAAEESPLLVVVDDLHWLDTSSRGAVLFAARRLQAEGIALLMAGRSGTGAIPDSEYSGLKQLRLEAMDRADADQLFDRFAPSASPDVRLEIYQEAAGNPLGIQEMCDQLTRHPTSLRASGIPPDSRLTRALSGRLGDLPESTRAALLLVAASGGAETDVVLRAARHCGLGLADFAPAEEAGLLVIDTLRIEFRHPLLRSVLYGTASTHARASAHAAIADVLADDPGDGPADARAWHLAVARIPPDDETARILEATGLRARRRGGYTEAARAFEQAARFGRPEDRAARLLGAARALQLAGRGGRVLVLLDEALPLADDVRLRAPILHMAAYLRMWRERPADGLAGLVGAAAEVEGVDPARAAFMYADAAIACFMLGRIAEALRLISRAHELARVGPEAGADGSVTNGAAPGGSGPIPMPGARSDLEAVQLVTEVAMAAVLAMRGQRREAAGHLDAAMDRLTEADPLRRAQEYAHGAFALIWLERYGEAAHLLDRVIERARAVGAAGVLPQALVIASELYFRLGRWSEAVAVATESVTLAAESRQPDLYGQYFVARMDAVQGRVDECRHRVDRITAISQRLGVGCMGIYTGHTLGLMALVAGDVEEAIRQLEIVRDLPITREVLDQGLVPWAYDLIEAYARCGRTVEAQTLLDSVTAALDDKTHSLQHALAARCRGLLAPREEMIAEFETALSWHDRSGLPFERARTLLCLGERLRRERQRAAARRHLRRALELFEQLGAPVWAERARAELSATGETHARGSGVAHELTPQELQVAMIVARGATNSEAAAALFLSPKTIEYHLSNIYRKTQLRSRSDLAVLASAVS